MRVTLQYIEKLPKLTMIERKKLLQDFFTSIPITTKLASFNVTIDPNSISVSGQFVEAIVPDSDINRITQELAKLKIGVDPIIQRNFF